MDIVFVITGVITGVGMVCGLAIGWGLVVGSASELFREW